MVQHLESTRGQFIELSREGVIMFQEVTVQVVWYRLTVNFSLFFSAVVPELGKMLRARRSSRPSFVFMVPRLLMDMTKSADGDSKYVTRQSLNNSYLGFRHTRIAKVNNFHKF